MIDMKTPHELEIMREGGKKLGHILTLLLDEAQPGITLNQLDRHADELIAQAGGAASFKTVSGYQWATCLCVNEVVVHGIPTEYVLKSGDILTIDIGMLYKGFHTDTAWTKIIENSEAENKNEEKKKFLHVGEDALWQAVSQARVGRRIGHISQAIQRPIEEAGFHIVRTLVGHGVGRTLHEEPQVPGMLKGPIEQTVLLKEGMTIAIEVIYAQGSGAVVYENDDGWSIATKDRSISAVFEHTVGITTQGPVVLTKREI